MDRTDQDEFKTLLQEMSAMYKGTVFNDFFVSGYWKILKPFPLSALRQACLQLMGDELRKDVMPSAAEIKAMARRFEKDPREHTFIACQEPHCTELVPWPPRIDGEAGMRCRFHPPSAGPAATHEDKRAIFSHLSPKGRAFVRSITELRHRWKDIPVDEEEAQFTEIDDRPREPQTPTPLKDAAVSEVYGVTAAEVKHAQAEASTRTMNHL